jgi:phosphatidylserine/phosphatidylglycerophosphate/cardiolipin synthase-like enzyme
MSANHYLEEPFMRAGITKNGLTLRVIAGTRSAILGIDLQENLRKGCLGFSIRRTDLGPTAKAAHPPVPEAVWLPNMLRFPDDKGGGPATTSTAPLQKFRWGDYTLAPAHRYRFQVVPRFGKPAALKAEPGLDEGVSVEVTTEDTESPETAIFFNRASAASRAFDLHFKQVKTEKQLLADTEEARAAKAWLSNGLEEALLAYLEKAADENYALHAAVYEFQKPELLAALKAAGQRGAEVKVAYHAREKPGAKDETRAKNEAAIKAAKFGKTVQLVAREADPQGAIMHNKFVVLLKKHGKDFVPQAVWTGSTNWTDGGLYGQLNVGHAVYDPELAATYERYFQLLYADSSSDQMKDELATLTPVSLTLSGEHKITPVFSPQSNDTMLHLYSVLCDGAKCVMVSAPFALSPIVLAALAKKKEDVLRYMLLDKMSSLGKGEEVHVMQGDPSDVIAAAATLPSPLHDFQGELLEGKESFRHAGIHIHSKVIMVDPLGSDPIVVTGSANFSHNSTEVNDSNSLVIRGHTAVADAYATEFMRMFEHYHFRASEAAAKGKAKPLGLVPDDSWSDKYYVSDSTEERDRRLFAGTH